MKTIKLAILLSIFTSFLYAQTPFMLTGIKSYYPVVEINSNKIDKKYKKIILESLIEISNELTINTKNFSSRSLTFLINYISVGDTLALKVALVMGEDMVRTDTKEEVFVLSYINTRIFIVEDIEEDLIDNVEELLEEFSQQYIEDNL